jgi:hypothetical protein
MAGITAKELISPQAAEGHLDSLAGCGPAQQIGVEAIGTGHILRN